MVSAKVIISSDLNQIAGNHCLNQAFEKQGKEEQPESLYLLAKVREFW